MQTDHEAGQVSIFGPDLWYGKMCRVLSVPIREEILDEFSLKQYLRGGGRPPMFLCLTVDGRWRDVYSEKVGAGPLLGEYWMHSFGESPNAAVESHLSQILEENPHPKYCLSEKACRGIIRRAKNREKELPAELPPILKMALEQQAERLA